jgi:Ca2+-binding RTX toxin-like protein
MTRLLLLATTVALLAVPGIARAATTIDAGASLQVTGDAFANHIEVRRIAGGYEITDPLARLEIVPGSACFFTDPPHEVRCQTATEVEVKLRGNAGADELAVFGGTLGARFIGDAGGDRLQGGPAGDVLLAGTGDDVVVGGGGGDRLDGSSGGDQLRGGPGFDTVTYEDRISGVTVTIPEDAFDRRADDGNTADGLGAESRDTVFEDVERVTGGGGLDELVGNDLANELEGGPGIDTLVGRGGDDELDGGRDPDVLAGSDGIDLVSYGTRSADVSVTLDGQANDGDATDLRADDVQADVEAVQTGSGDDVLLGNGADNILRGGRGSDTLDGRGGADDLSGGEGPDTAAFEARGAGVQVSQDGVANDGNAQDRNADNVRADIETLSGTPHADVLRGADGAQTLLGREGDDRLEGLGGDDLLNGGPQASLIGDGTDVLDGGAGVDTASYANALSVTQITLDGLANDGSTGGDENDNVLTENVIGSNLQDTLIGDSGANELLGGDSADTLRGGGGPDVLVGGPGPDTLQGEAGADALQANDGVADAIDCGADFDGATFDLADLGGGPFRAGSIPLLAASAGCEKQIAAAAGRLPNVVAGSVRADGHRALVRLRCPRGSQQRCHGTLRLRRLDGTALGRGRFSIARGHGGSVAVRLRPAVRHGVVEVLTRETDADGRVKVTLRRVRLP